METEKISRKHSVHVATCTVCGGKRVIHNSVLNARVRSINARVRFLCIFMYLLLIFCEEERQ